MKAAEKTVQECESDRGESERADLPFAKDAKDGAPDECRLLLADGPKNANAFLDCSEVFVAGGERGFAVGSQRGGKTIGIGEFVFGAQFGCGTR